MKSLFLIIIICKVMRSAYYNHKDLEPFFIFKCIFYLFASSIHSVVINIPLPLGACIMFIASLFDIKNRTIKLKMICTGLLVIILSNFNFDSLSYPLQKLYMYETTHDIQKIEVFAHTSKNSDFIFAITDPEDLFDWTTSLQSSTPYSSWNTKTLPNDYGYLLKLTSSKNIQTIFLSSNASQFSNLFLGDKQIPYTNSTIYSLITKFYPLTPTVLTINTSKESAINITYPMILNILWRNITWFPTEPLSNYQQEMFSIPAYLFFDTNLGCKFSFSHNFDYAYIHNRGVMKLSPYLKNMLNEQFILSQLDITEELDIFEPAHTSTKSTTSLKFSIEPDENDFYYGFYREDYKNDEKILLHTVNSPNAKYFLLKNPYILLLDERSPSQYFLMLINQNLPEKHRYIEKNQSILPHSISICPQNTKFTYIVENQENSILYFVDNYYHSPISIATGIINDSLFLSDEYIVFTQQLDNDNLLCIYNTNQSKIIKYILIPGNITLIESGNNKIYFAVQKVDNMNLKQGIFYIDNTLTVHKFE